MSIETKHGLIFDISENIILKNLLGMAGTRISFRNPGVCGLYCFEDDSGLYDGTGMTCDGAEITPSGFIFRWHSECFSLESEFSYDFDSKVWSRCDSVTNITDKVQTIYSCLSRFVLESAAVEVYTQSSVWNHENQGVWAPLVTSVTAENHGLRTTEGSTPIAAVRQKGQNGGVVFHLFPMGKWKINVSKRIGTSGSMHTVIDMGLSDEKLKLKVAPGEKLQLPEIVFFRFNDEALDAHKLHRYLIKNKLSTNIPPVIYNSWFLDFDVLDFEYFRAQVDVASKLGIEVFTVDAGWFGDGVHWTRSVGDWEENQVGAFGGRMRELAEYVRSKGIKFGLWMEPERATPHSKLYNKNPDLFFLSDSGDYVADMSLKPTRDIITERIAELVDTYRLEMMKLDFNTYRLHAPKGDGFYRYYRGLYDFMDNLRERFPQVCFEACASGGMRTDVSTMSHYELHFLTDTVNPSEVLRISQGAMLRLPPYCLSKWIALRGGRSNARFYNTPKGSETSRTFSCSDATWERIESISPDFASACIFSGVLGVTSDLTSLDESARTTLAKWISLFKSHRKQLRRSVCYQLSGAMTEKYDKTTVSVLQMQDTESSHCILLFYRFEGDITEITAVPRDIKSDKLYKVTIGENTEHISGEVLATCGVTVSLPMRYTAEYAIIEEE